MTIRTIKDLEIAVSQLPVGDAISIDAICITQDAYKRLQYYIQDDILIPGKEQAESLYKDKADLVMNGDEILAFMKYTKAPSMQDIADNAEKAFTPIIEHLESLNLEQQQKIDELETQLLQYQVCVSDIFSFLKEISALISARTGQSDR